jgi:hypothetical protein
MRGAFKKDPQRRDARSNEPESTGELGDPPAEWEEKLKACWREIVGLVAPGVLQKSDRLAVEMAANMLMQMREAKWNVPAAYLTRYETLLGKFGMTPSERSKVSVPKSPKENPFAKFGKRDTA